MLYEFLNKKRNLILLGSTSKIIDVKKNVHNDLISFIQVVHRYFHGKIIWMLISPVSQQFKYNDQIRPDGTKNIPIQMSVDLNIKELNTIIRDILVNNKERNIIDPTPYHTKTFMNTRINTLDDDSVEGYIDPFHFGGSALKKTINDICVN